MDVRGDVELVQGRQRRRCVQEQVVMIRTFVRCSLYRRSQLRLIRYAMDAITQSANPKLSNDV